MRESLWLTLVGAFFSSWTLMCLSFQDLENFWIFHCCCCINFSCPFPSVLLEQLQWIFACIMAFGKSWKLYSLFSFPFHPSCPNSNDMSPGIEIPSAAAVCLLRNSTVSIFFCLIFNARIFHFLKIIFIKIF